MGVAPVAHLVGVTPVAHLVGVTPVAHLVGVTPLALLVGVTRLALLVGVAPRPLPLPVAHLALPRPLAASPPASGNKGCATGSPIQDKAHPCIGPNLWKPRPSPSLSSGHSFYILLLFLSLLSLFLL